MTTGVTGSRLARRSATLGRDDKKNVVIPAMTITSAIVSPQKSTRLAGKAKMD
jgi:hypothetical protein